jgi:hypothetical protein
MLKEMNGIVRDLLGLHGYPVAPVRPSVPPSRTLCADEQGKAAPSRSRLARRVLVLAKVALGPSAMGHVHW